MNTISSQSKTFKTSITKEEIAELPIEEFNGQIEIVQTIEEAKKCYETVEPKGWWYQDKYPDIFEKYASQYYN